MLVRLRLAKGFLVFALMLSIGAHWAFLQSVAWVGMIFDYSSEAGLRQGIEMTFDGDHPCKLCKLVRESTREKQEQPVLKLEIKVDKSLPAELATWTRTELCQTLALPPCPPLTGRISSQPPTPPPRFV